MSDPKKIVIKINRAPAPQKVTSTQSAPHQITEWNVKRIVGALFVVLLLIIVPYYYLDDELDDLVEDDSAEIHYELNEEVLNTEETQREAPAGEKISEKTVAEMEFDKPAGITSGNTAELPAKPSAKSVQVPMDKPVVRKIEQSIVHPKVIRSLLARGIADKEPFGEIKTSVLVNNDKATGVFYFTEIKDMKGHMFYHQWLRDGRLVYKRSIKVRGNHWRASTSKLFSSSSGGNWTARLIDKEGRIYNEIKFKVIAE